jgi:hypothetical protein
LNKMSTYPALCESLRELSAWSWGKLEKADRLGIAYNEETITENLLLELALRHSGRDLDIRAYTKIEEGKGTKATGGKPTGADWAFWFSDSNNKGIELRIQAKRLFGPGTYDSLDGTGKQIKDLKNNSGNAIPLYVFYNGQCTDMLKHMCASLCCFPTFLRDTDWGCTYAPLSAIPKKKPRPSEITHMRPWHTLVCDCPCLPSCETPGGQARNLPQCISAAVGNAYQSVTNSDGPNKKLLKTLNFSADQAAPEWTALLMKKDERAKSVLGDDADLQIDIDSYLTKHGLRGVAIISERRKGI